MVACYSNDRRNPVPKRVHKNFRIGTAIRHDPDSILEIIFVRWTMCIILCYSNKSKTMRTWRKRSRRDGPFLEGTSLITLKTTVGKRDKYTEGRTQEGLARKWQRIQCCPHDREFVATTSSKIFKNDDSRRGLDTNVGGGITQITPKKKLNHYWVRRPLNMC